MKLTEPGAIRVSIWFSHASKFNANLVQYSLLPFQNVGAYENPWPFELDRWQCTAERFIRRFGVRVIRARHRLDATNKIANAHEWFTVPEWFRSRIAQPESRQQRNSQRHRTRPSREFLQRTRHRGEFRMKWFKEATGNWMMSQASLV